MSEAKLYQFTGPDPSSDHNGWMVIVRGISKGDCRAKVREHLQGMGRDDLANGVMNGKVVGDEGDIGASVTVRVGHCRPAHFQGQLGRRSSMSKSSFKITYQVGAYRIKLSCPDLAGMEQALRLVHHSAESSQSGVQFTPVPPIPATDDESEDPPKGSLSSNWVELIRKIESAGSENLRELVQKLYSAEDFLVYASLLKLKMFQGDRRKLGQTIGALTRMAKSVGIDPEDLLLYAYDKKTNAKAGVKISLSFQNSIHRFGINFSD